MKNKLLFLGYLICSVAFLVCGCAQKTKAYNINDKDSDSEIQIALKSEGKGKNLNFMYVGDKIDFGIVNDDGSVTLYTEDQKKKQIEELGRGNTLDIVEENGLKINYSAHPSDDLSTLPDKYDEYIYAVGSEDGGSVGTIHILMNEEAFKNRFEEIKNEYVPAGMDLYSDGLNIQGFSDENSPYGNIEMKWIPEAKKGYMIEIGSDSDYSFEDISCSINLKKEIESDEEYYETKKSEKEMTQYIADTVKESGEIEQVIYQDNIATLGLPIYDEEGYLVDGVGLYDENGDIIYIGEDKDHKWCYDERGWIVRADTVDVPYTLSEKGYKAGEYDTRYGDLVPIK